MSIDPFEETVLPFAKAVRELPQLKKNAHVHPETLWRWATRGLRGIKLETVQIGGVIFASVESLHRCVDALAQAKGHEPVSRPSSQHQDEIERQLQQFGG